MFTLVNNSSSSPRFSCWLCLFTAVQNWLFFLGKLLVSCSSLYTNTMQGKQRKGTQKWCCWDENSKSSTKKNADMRRYKTLRTTPEEQDWGSFVTKSSTTLPNCQTAWPAKIHQAPAHLSSTPWISCLQSKQCHYTAWTWPVTFLEHPGAMRLESGGSTGSW